MIWSTSPLCIGNTVCFNNGTATTIPSYPHIYKLSVFWFPNGSTTQHNPIIDWWRNHNNCHCHYQTAESSRLFSSRKSGSHDLLARLLAIGDRVIEPLGDALGRGRYPLGTGRTWLPLLAASEAGVIAGTLLLTSFGRTLVSSIPSQKYVFIAPLPWNSNIIVLLQCSINSSYESASDN